MATSITQYSITINFDSDYVVGQYNNGDYYVVSPSGIGITGITVLDGSRQAGSVAGRDGAMIDPIPGASNGYDSRLNSYDSSLNKVHSGFPFSLPTGKSLFASESALVPRTYSASGGNEIYLETAIVINCVSSEPQSNSFRPHYCSGTKTTYNYSDVIQENIPALNAVSNIPVISTVQSKIQRVQLDHKVNWTGRQMHPYSNMRDYGRDFCTDWGEVLCMMLLDSAHVGTKTTLIKYAVQLGIDLHGIKISGGSWPANGGHGMGRKALIMLAGHLLGVSEMRDVGFLPSIFQEDGQSFYVTQADVNIVHKPRRTNYVNDAEADYISSDIGLPEWGIVHSAAPVQDDKSLNASYRDINALPWMAHALTMCVLGLQDTYSNPAYFDYVNRYWTSINANAATTFQTNMMTAYWEEYYTEPVGPLPSMSVRSIPRSSL